VTVDLTGISCAVIAGVFSVLSVVLPLWISAHIKDQAAAATVATAIRNSLGALQQASTAAAQSIVPALPIKGVPPAMVPGVQYVLDHAGDEVARLGITSGALASKISAQVGLANIQTNVAVAGSASPAVPNPLGPVPVNPTI
jgi:hypothetical protein